jgi:antitoxin component of MazEF toxin-antitoxin module
MKKAEAIRAKTAAQRGRAGRSEQRPNLRKLVAQITPKNLHDETDWGAEQGKEKISWRP